ncbi:MAG: NADH-quinone oxidoreductase subunit NuoN [Halothiobacillaceae bacterium]
MTFASLNITPVLPEIVLAAMACIILLIDPFMPKNGRKVSFALSLGTLAVLFLITLVNMDGTVRLSFSDMVVNDPMADVMKLVVYLLSAAVFVMARGYLRDRGIDKGEFYMLGLFGILGMMIMISANHLLLVYLGLELMSLSLYAMVAFRRDDGRASEAAMKYFVLGALASGLLLYGMSILYGVTGTLYLSEIATAVALDGESAALKLALVMIVVGLVFKLGAAPFHMWLPDVYDGAPTGITLYLAAAPKIAGLAVLIRVLVEGLGPMLSDWQPMLVVVVMLSLLVGNLIAIAQTSFKRMLTYSSISHVGFILMALLAGTQEGYGAALFYTIAYSIMTLAGFGMVVLLARKGFEGDQLDDLKGLNDRSPVMAFVFLVLMFSMAGIPFTLGFWAKLGVLQAVVQVDMWWLALFAVVLAVIGAFYYLRAVKLVYFDKPESDAVLAGAEVRWLLAVGGLIVAVMGLYPSWLIAVSNGVFLLQ